MMYTGHDAIQEDRDKQQAKENMTPQQQTAELVQAEAARKNAPQNVPQLVTLIGSGFKQLQSAVAAYGSLLRIIEAASTHAAGEDSQRAPIITWPARLDDALVEVMTDLSQIPPEQLAAVLAPMVNVHAAQMGQAANQIHQAAGLLVNVIEQSQKQAGPG